MNHPHARDRAYIPNAWNVGVLMGFPAHLFLRFVPDVDPCDEATARQCFRDVCATATHAVFLYNDHDIIDVFTPVKSQ